MKEFCPVCCEATIIRAASQESKGLRYKNVGFGVTVVVVNELAKCESCLGYEEGFRLEDTKEVYYATPYILRIGALVVWSSDFISIENDDWQDIVEEAIYLHTNNEAWAFVRAISENPADEAPYLIMADYISERPELFEERTPRHYKALTHRQDMQRQRPAPAGIATTSMNKISLKEQIDEALGGS